MKENHREDGNVKVCIISQDFKQYKSLVYFKHKYFIFYGILHMLHAVFRSYQLCMIGCPKKFLSVCCMIVFLLYLHSYFIVTIDYQGFSALIST